MVLERAELWRGPCGLLAAWGNQAMLCDMNPVTFMQSEEKKPSAQSLTDQPEQELKKQQISENQDEQQGEQQDEKSEQTDATFSSAIMYIPEGTHEIEASVNGKARKLTITLPPEKGEQLAAQFQQELEQRLTENVRPIFDFDHAGTGAAAAIPTRFFYEAGKGIMVDAEWTGAGKSARESRDYSYFSPTFLHDEATGEPSGLPARGPLGALVNDPAFRDIERVAAKRTYLVDNNMNEQRKIKYMNLVKAGVLTADEALSENAQQIANQKISAMRASAEQVSEVKAKLETVTAERDALKKQARSVQEVKAQHQVQEAVNTGRIPALDKETQAFWTKQLVEHPEAADAALRAIQPAFDYLTEPMISASNRAQDPASNKSEHKLLKLAKEKVSKGESKSEEEALRELAAEFPELYEDYRASLNND